MMAARRGWRRWRRRGEGVGNGGGAARAAAMAAARQGRRRWWGGEGSKTNNIIFDSKGGVTCIFEYTWGGGGCIIDYTRQLLVRCTHRRQYSILHEKRCM